MFKQAITKQNRQKSILTAKGILQAYVEMAYDAVGVSGSDLEAGLEFFKSLPQNVPWVSANIFTDNHTLFFSPYVIKKINALTVGIIGLTGQPTHKLTKITVEDWKKSLKVHLEQLKKRCDIVIVLSSLNNTENRELVNRFQDVDFLISSLKNRGNMVPRIVRNTMLTQCAPQGKYLGKLHLQWYPHGTWKAAPTISVRKPELINSYTSAFLPVRPVITPNPVSEIVDQIKKDVNSFNKTQQKALQNKKNSTNNKKSPANEYAGSSSCTQCHQEQYDSWSRTAHAHAFATLVKKKQSLNSDCLPCHVTSNVSENSAENKKIQLLTLPAQFQAVGCEVCHGPGQKHINAPATNKPVQRPPLAVCLKCHTPQRDNTFDYQKKLAAVSCTRNSH